MDFTINTQHAHLRKNTVHMQVVHIILTSRRFIMFIYYQYFYGNAQFSKTCVNGALIEKKNNLQHNRNKNSTIVYQRYETLDLARI